MATARFSRSPRRCTTSLQPCFQALELGARQRLPQKLQQPSAESCLQTLESLECGVNRASCRLHAAHVHKNSGEYVASMALREFTDDHGRRWTVWDVYPTLAE